MWHVNLRVYINNQWWLNKDQRSMEHKINMAVGQWWFWHLSILIFEWYDLSGDFFSYSKEKKRNSKTQK